MNIKKVKTAKKVGKFILRTDNHRNLIGFEYEKNIKPILDNEDGRVYLFTSNGEIKKIGGSTSVGGIKSTLNPYLSSMTGSPGAPRFVIHLLIRDLLKTGKNVECYIITSPKIIASVSGLFGIKNMEIVSFTEMERECKTDYKKTEGRYPDWNFKENSDPYPSKYAKMHNEYHKNRLDTD